MKKQSGMTLIEVMVALVAGGRRQLAHSLAGGGDRSASVAGAGRRGSPRQKR